MTKAEFRAALDERGINAEYFATVTGYHRVTVYRWLREGPPASKATAIRRLLTTIRKRPSRAKR